MFVSRETEGQNAQGAKTPSDMTQGSLFKKTLKGSTKAPGTSPSNGGLRHLRSSSSCRRCNSAKKARSGFGIVDTVMRSAQDLAHNLKKNLKEFSDSMFISVVVLVLWNPVCGRVELPIGRGRLGGPAAVRFVHGVGAVTGHRRGGSPGDTEHLPLRVIFPECGDSDSRGLRQPGWQGGRRHEQ